jgi:hypothetical protein
MSVSTPLISPPPPSLTPPRPARNDGHTATCAPPLFGGMWASWNPLGERIQEGGHGALEEAGLRCVEKKRHDFRRRVSFLSFSISSILSLTASEPPPSSTHPRQTTPISLPAPHPHGAEPSYGPRRRPLQRRTQLSAG